MPVIQFKNFPPCFPLLVRTNENKNGARRPDVGFMDAIQYRWFLDCIKSARRAYINFKLQHPQRNKFIWFISSSPTCMIYGDETPVLILKLTRLCRVRFHKSGKGKIRLHGKPAWMCFCERTRANFNIILGIEHFYSESFLCITKFYLKFFSDCARCF